MELITQIAKLIDYQCGYISTIGTSFDGKYFTFSTDIIESKGSWTNPPVIISTVEFFSRLFILGSSPAAIVLKF